RIGLGPEARKLLEEATTPDVTYRRARHRRVSGVGSRGQLAADMRGGRQAMKLRMLLVLCAALALSAGVTFAGAASVTLDGSFSFEIVKKDFVSNCPSGVADECGPIQLAGLGDADWAYTFGPTFDPDGS